MFSNIIYRSRPTCLEFVVVIERHETPVVTPLLAMALFINLHVI